MQFDRSRIRDGMTVYSSDGEKLGKVLSCEASMFVIEKGFFFPKDYVARYDDVTTIDDDGIRLALSKDAFRQMREAGKEGEGWRAGSVDTTGQPRATDADVLATDYGLDRAGRPTGTAGGEWRSGLSGTSSGTGDRRVLERRAADEEVRKEHVEEERDDRTRRMDQTDEELGTARRMGDESTSGATRRMSDEDDPFFGMPPRDDT